MGFFGDNKKDVDEAKPSFDRSYFKDGIYICQVKSIKFDIAYANDKPYYCAEFDILQRVTPQGNDPGTSASWITFFSGKGKSIAMSNCKDLLASIQHVDPKFVDDAALDLSYAQNQPLTGMVLRVKAREGHLKALIDEKDPSKGFKPFTFHSFEKCEMSNEEIVKLRAQYGMAPLLPKSIPVGLRNKVAA